ncbi:MAG: phosphoribosylformylglycinamidine synthase [Erysipelotrichaceae bacterium]|nr:phosphoribosylformylglycinamidine synthase [Erysipelotrichaceae bacterium]
MINKRVFVEKKLGFQTEAKDLLYDLRENLLQDIKKLRIVLVYDVFNIEEEIFEQAVKTVFSEVMVDNVYYELDLTNEKYISLESLPGQYDQRADSAVQCIKLLDPKSSAKVTCGKVIIFEGNFDLKKVESYLINPIESRVKDLTKMEIDHNIEVTPLKSLKGFINLDEKGLNDFLINMSLAMSKEDLKMVQDYFVSEKRDPSEVELRVLDTYWSDHCRHTTFETKLESIEIKDVLFKIQIEKSLKKYLKYREELKRTEKPVTLMDLATINSRYLRSLGYLKEVEISDEINACSVFVDIDNDGVNEKWLMQFKNETHNHPTEIEPFGGASTCIGGAIRDPLSGRSYVYQAMRISGSANVFTPIEDTIEGKLSQRLISKRSAAGNSSYGNQIGLPTTFVKEIYDDAYVAKHLEMGAVVGAVKYEDIKREKPLEGDVVILLGGRTGRDGIGGATGSSKTHDESSLETSASEVQKGNAPEERKIQRLFRNPECSKLIKKCNDFGAGGVCVAIGELADGLIIDLSKVRTKYAGLNAMEIAISESQERMAVVVASDDVQKFIELAALENLEAYEVAIVTKEPLMKMIYNDEVVVEIKRSFIDSAGARQSVDVTIENNDALNPFESMELTKENILKTLSNKNVACQKGLVEMFDASVGATTVLMPFGGVKQLTPIQASVQKFPVLSGNTKSTSTLAYGFIPSLMSYSCYMGAMYSVLLSISKTIAVGNNLKDIHFSFQEYFERLNDESHKWGKVTSALLGAFEVQDFFNLASIGGKDSMSGSFNDLHVCPTLISIACTKGNVDDIISSEFKNVGSKIGILLPKIDDLGLPDLDSFKQIYQDFENNKKEILSSYVVEEGGIISALFKQSFGNNIGFSINSDLDLLKLIPGAIIVETKDNIESDLYVLLGNTVKEDYIINDIPISFEEALDSWTNTFDELYPRYWKENIEKVENIEYYSTKKFKAKNLVDEVNVLIPVFPGNNCEYDVQRAFKEEGAKTKILIFRNLDEQMVNDSIDKLADEIDNTHILAFPGGFSSGDEPDGSAKFIVNVLQNDKIKNSINRLLERDGLIIGICNGFQALVKSGLLPYGNIQVLNDDDCTLYKNDINRHISTIVNTKTSSTNSPWLQGMEVNSVYSVPISHGEGKFIVNDQMLKQLIDNGQIAFQYCDENGNVSGDSKYNVNGSTYAIEGIVSLDGKILGKMGHSERYYNDVFKNISGNKKQSIFSNGVNYFKKEKQNV